MFVHETFTNKFSCFVSKLKSTLLVLQWIQFVRRFFFFNLISRINKNQIIFEIKS